jgi:hypothetical protein
MANSPKGVLGSGGVQSSTYDQGTIYRGSHTESSAVKNPNTFLV